MSSKPLTKAQLAAELGFPDPETVVRLARRRVIPQIRLGYRTRLYDLEACRAALAKRTIKAL